MSQRFSTRRGGLTPSPDTFKSTIFPDDQTAQRVLVEGPISALAWYDNARNKFWYGGVFRGRGTFYSKKGSQKRFPQLQYKINVRLK